MTRDQARHVLSDLNISGDLYRGYMIIGLDRGEWRIPTSPSLRFSCCWEARCWVDDCIKEFSRYTNV
jgi:hypothetical protein